MCAHAMTAVPASTPHRPATSDHARRTVVPAFCAIVFAASVASGRQNVLQNPGFESGVSGYATQYLPGANAPGHSTVGTNPNAWNPAWPGCTDHTSPGDKMLLVDGIVTSKFWSETITVQPNTWYSFRFWHLTLDPFGRHPPHVVAAFRDTGIGLVNVAEWQFSAASSCTWVESETSWYTGSTTQVEVYMYDTEGAPDGNDLALDDLVLEPCTKVPVIVLHPPAQVTAAPGSPFSLSVTATVAGGAPLTYQWRHGGLPLSDDGRITGSLTATLTFSPLRRIDLGTYDCQVSSPCATTTTPTTFVRVIRRLGSADRPVERRIELLNSLAQALLERASGVEATIASESSETFSPEPIVADGR